MFLCFYVFIYLCFYASIIYYFEKIGLLKTHSDYVILGDMKNAKLILNVIALSVAVTLLLMVSLPIEKKPVTNLIWLGLF